MEHYGLQRWRMKRPGWLVRSPTIVAPLSALESNSMCELVHGLLVVEHRRAWFAEVARQKHRVAFVLLPLTSWSRDLARDGQGDVGCVGLS